MSRLPIPHIINTIKTKLGFDRTLTASGEDVVDAVNKQSQQIEEKKSKQSAVADPSASGTSVTFISGITQNEQGVISPSKKTVSTMGAATSSAAGTAGLVPAPASGNQSKFLRGDATWQTPTDTKNTAGSTDSSSKLFLIGATSQAANPQTYSQDTAYVGTDGCLYSGGTKVLTAHQDISGKKSTQSAVSDPTASGTSVEFISGISQNAQGVISPSKKTVRTMGGASADAAGSTGLVPAPAAGKQTQFLRGDGTWQTPTHQTIKQDGVTGATANRYATCSTAANTAAKTATITSGTFTLETGATVYVKFTNSNTVASPTLNVNSTGAKSIMRYGTTAAGTSAATSWTAGSVVSFTYDGTNWIMQSAWDNNTTYSNASLGQGYGTCTTAAATEAKVVTLSSYALTTGGVVSVKFTNSVPASATMNINSKGAKAIFYKGAAITTGVIEAGDLATFIYDGTQYHLLSIDRWHDNLSNLSTDIDGLITNIGDVDALQTSVKTDVVAAVNSLIPVSVPLTHIVPSYPSGISDHDGGCFYSVYGNIVFYRFSFKITGSRTADTQIAFNHNIPSDYASNTSLSIICSNGTSNGYTNIVLTIDNIRIYPQKASGNEYWIGTICYIK